MKVSVTLLFQYIFVLLSTLFTVQATQASSMIVADFNLSATTICEGECISITDASQNAATWGWRFEGSMMTNTSLPTPPIQCYPNAGVFSIRLIVTDGSNRDTMIKMVTVLPLPTIDLGNDTTICEFQSVNLDATYPNASYQWSTGATSPLITVQGMGIYTVKVALGACQVMDTMAITTIATPIIDLGEDRMFCSDEVISLDIGTPSALSYLWQNGDTTSTLDITGAGMYYVEIQYNSGCFNSDTIIFFPEETLKTNLPTDTFFCKNTQLILDASEEEATSYQWGSPIFYLPNDLQKSALAIRESGIYTVFLENDCFEIEKTVAVEELDCGCYPFVPSGFSPNNDGYNDEFKVYASCEILDFSLKIFDRWGSLVFSSQSQDTGWKGIINNNLAQNGVYVWLLEYQAKTERGTIENRIDKGSVVLMK